MNNIDSALKGTVLTTSLFFLIVVGISCNKEKPQPAVANISIQVEVVDNSLPLLTARVFLKVSAIEFPGTDTTVYDQRDSVNIFGKVTFDSLFIGN